MLCHLFFSVWGLRATQKRKTGARNEFSIRFERPFSGAAGSEITRTRPRAKVKFACLREGERAALAAQSPWFVDNASVGAATGRTAGICVCGYA